MAWRARGATGLVVTLALVVAVCGQSTPAVVAAESAKDDGRLTVWIVQATPPGRARQVARTGGAPATAEYREQTAGSFGQTAGSVGQTAGSTGTTMGNFGQTAGSVGQTVANTGQTAGSLPSNVTSQTAGSAGKTMGEFGVSTTDLPKAAAAANTVGGRPRVPLRRPAWVGFIAGAGEALRDVELKFVDVYDEDLDVRLTETAGSDAAPDVLVGDPLPLAWMRPETGLVHRLGVYALWGSQLPGRIPEWTAVRTDARLSTPQYAVLRNARHPRTAREFALWMADGRGGPVTPSRALLASDTLGKVAVRAMRYLLAGQGPGIDADADFAAFDGGPIRDAALAAYGLGAVNGLELQVDVTERAVHGALAVVGVRGIGTAQDAYGVVHATEVLRRDAGGKWRVLQITPFLPAALEAREAQAFENASLAAIPGSEIAGGPLGIVQAAPIDGESRPSRPELWWDNRGGAALQVVEWQRQADQADQADGQAASGWAISQLFFVPDANSRLRTQVTANFASSAAKYRWRVWSVGHEGRTVITGWRTLNIVR
jgi:hypothetical protein